MTAVVSLPVAQQGQCTGCPAPGSCANRCPDVVRNIVDAGADRIGAVSGAAHLAGALAPLIDHPLLKPDAVRKDVDVLCEEAMRWKFASVCVNPTWVGHCARLLATSPVKVAWI